MAGSTSIAVRTIVGEDNTLNWVLGDHLGSASVTTTDDGTWYSELRYSAFGETRYSSGVTPTDYRYTGQLEQADVNLYYYNARWYDPELGRFIQADTIVPGAGSLKSYDRFTYVNNNPIRYTDPSGHCIAENNVRMSEYPYGTSGLCSDYTPTRIVPGQIPSSNIPAGVNTWNGIVTWSAMEELGITNDLQGAMDYVAANEFTPEQLENPDQSTTMQMYAMARRYYQYCSDDPWGASCVQSFWGYVQGLVYYFDNPETYVNKQNEVSASIASAILNPGQAAYVMSPKYNPIEVKIDQSIADEGCSTNGLCEWALFPGSWIDTIFSNYAENGKSFNSGEYGNTTYWSRVTYTDDQTAYAEAFYIYDFGNREYLVIMDENTKSYLCNMLGTCY